MLLPPCRAFATRRTGDAAAAEKIYENLGAAANLPKDLKQEADLLATVVAMVNGGRVRLCGNFKGARFDLNAFAEL